MSVCVCEREREREREKEREREETLAVQYLQSIVYAYTYSCIDYMHA